MSKASEQEKTEAIERLRGWVKPGDTIYCVLRHVSSSGMMRVIDLKHIEKVEGQGEPCLLTLGYNVALALGMKYDRSREGVRIGGCGMDMGFELVYNMGRVLFPQGFDLTPTNHARNGDPSGFDTDGGYALNHRWM